MLQVSSEMPRFSKAKTMGVNRVNRVNRVNWSLPKWVATVASPRRPMTFGETLANLGDYFLADVGLFEND